jgi:hypothetical protein
MEAMMKQILFSFLLMNSICLVLRADILPLRVTYLSSEEYFVTGERVELKIFKLDYMWDQIVISKIQQDGTCIELGRVKATRVTDNPDKGYFMAWRGETGSFFELKDLAQTFFAPNACNGILSWMGLGEGAPVHVYAKP